MKMSNQQARNIRGLVLPNFTYNGYGAWISTTPSVRKIQRLTNEKIVAAENDLTNMKYEMAQMRQQLEIMRKDLEAAYDRTRQEGTG